MAFSYGIETEILFWQKDFWALRILSPGEIGLDLLTFHKIELIRVRNTEDALNLDR